MFDLLLESLWLGPLLWATIYVSDYYLTIACARLYHDQEKITLEGSYELTPFYQTDVNALRRVSPRFLLALLASTGYVLLVRAIAGWLPGFFVLYVGVLGALVLLEATIHVRHLRNWFLFSRGAALIKGHVEYPRGLMLRMSSFELLLFSALYLGLFAFTWSTFVLGGALACAVLSFNHYRLARRHQAALSKAG